jgi:hypothetical protein
VVEGMGPLKPGNLYIYKGAKSRRIFILEDEVCENQLFLSEGLFYLKHNLNIN